MLDDTAIWHRRSALVWACVRQAECKDRWSGTGLGYARIVMWNGTLGDAIPESPAVLLGLASKWDLSRADSARPG